MHKEIYQYLFQWKQQQSCKLDDVWFNNFTFEIK